ncbi:MAG: thiol-disulfide oxidoreductase [Methanomassiliicoccales archaeon PtaU1.Bin124]|nr:MAG: thiol-disulfide oxidoreductase [Methanomassiliicoccales archaeon PtaU1.Bin124]
MSWVGSKPLNLQDLAGKVVVLNFWTASRLECVRDLQKIVALKERFHGRPIEFIGIHSAEFDFCNDAHRLKEICSRLGLSYPIGIDKAFSTWTDYEIEIWPTQLLIDAHGVVRFIHEGEGGEAELEAWVVRLLNEVGARDTFGPPSCTRKQVAPPEYIFCGALRNQGIGNEQEGHAFEARGFEDDGVHERGAIYLGGCWFHDLQFLRHEGREAGHLALRFNSSDLYLVLSDGASDVISVTLDGGPLKKEHAGNDISFKDGKSIIIADRDGLYHLVRSNDRAEHEIRLTLDSDAPCLYSIILA